MKYRVEHKEAVTEVVTPATVVLTLTPKAADMLAVLLSHVQMNSLNEFELPRPGALSDRWQALNDLNTMKVNCFVDDKWVIAKRITISLAS